MHDIILIEGLEVCCVIGIQPHERLHPQRVVVDLELAIPAVHHQDALLQSVDYAHVSQEIENILKERQFQTLEYAAQVLIEDLFVLWQMIMSIRCTLRKPTAIYAAHFVGVRMYRERR